MQPTTAKKTKAKASKTKQTSKAQPTAIEHASIPTYPIEYTAVEAIQPTLPPIDNSIKYVDNTFPGKAEKEDKMYDWKLLSELHAKYTVFECIKPIQLNVTIQNSFAFALNCLASTPEAILSMYRPSNTPASFEIKVNSKGANKTVTIDDFFPSTGILTLSPKLFNNDIWLIALEKAFAKVNHSYHSIKNINPTLPLYAFTGAPSMFLTHSMSSKQILWGGLEFASDKHYLMIAEQSMDAVKSYRRIICCALLKTPKGDKKILKICTESSHSCDLKEDQTIWTPENQEKMKYDAKEPNIIYLDLDSYSGLFQCTLITDYCPSYKLYSKAITHGVEGYAIIQIKVDSIMNGSIYITKEHREQGAQGSCRAAICREDSKGCEYINGLVFEGDYLYLIRDCQLLPGNYYLLVEGDSKDYIVINSYCSAPVTIELVKAGYEKALASILKSACISLVKPRILKEDSDISVYFNPMDTKNAFGCLYYKNCSESGVWERVVFDNYEGYSFFPPFNNTKNSAEIFTNPKSEEIVMFRYRQTKKNEILGTSITTVVKKAKGDIKSKLTKANIAMQYDENGQMLDVYLHIIPESDGVTAVYINNTVNKVLDIVFRLSLTNLKTTDGKTEYQLHLDPGQVITIDMVPIKMGMKYKYSFEDAFTVTTR